MQLVLIRHGKAELQFTNDDDRALTPKGQMQAERLGRWLTRFNFDKPTIWHSNKLRAQETAHIINAQAGWNSDPEMMHGLRPSSPVEPIADRIAAEDSDLVIIGHMPFMSAMASHMVSNGKADTHWDFGTGGALILERAGLYEWVVQGFLRPSMLKSIEKG